MQQQKGEIQKRRSHKKCSVKGCVTKGERMFTFPSEHSRCQKWIEACGREDLLNLPLQKLRTRTVCAVHFEKKYFLWAKLSKSAVPTCLLPNPATSVIEPKIEENEIVIKEEYQPDCTMACMDYVDSEDIARDIERSAGIVSHE